LKGLIIDSPHIQNILNGKKIWEMRSTSTKVRGLIALIQKGSGSVVGTVNLSGSLGPLSEDEMLRSTDKHLIDPNRVASGATAKWRHAWVLSSAHWLPTPVRYSHPSGAVIWVNLDPEVEQQVIQQLR